MASVKAIDALLPQTQCGECGFGGCLPYAEALFQGRAPINYCPPGGIKTLKALGELLNIDPKPYLEEMKANTRSPSIAFIQEESCIGCTKCIQACPVDAIVGSAKFLHNVIPDECTGCGLCVEPCPVNCIEMLSIPQSNYDKTLARTRFQAKQMRNLREQQEKETLYKEKRKLSQQSEKGSEEISAKRNFVLEALARAQAKKNQK